MTAGEGPLLHPVIETSTVGALNTRRDAALEQRLDAPVVAHIRNPGEHAGRKTDSRPPKSTVSMMRCAQRHESPVASALFESIRRCGRGRPARLRASRLRSAEPPSAPAR